MNFGISDPTPHVGDSVTVSGEVRLEHWDVWTTSYGSEERIYNYSSAASGVLVTLGQESGGGHFSDITATTGLGGWFATTYTVGSDGGVRLSASVPGASASDPGWSETEFWPLSPEHPVDPGDGGAFLHSDGAVRLGGPHADGPVYGLGPGEVRALSGEIFYESWEVWSDGHGGTLAQNGSATPLEGEPVVARLAYGDGLLAGAASPVALQSGPDGGIALDFTMGEEASRVEFVRHGEVLGHLDLTPPPGPAGPAWTFSRRGYGRRVRNRAREVKRHAAGIGLSAPTWSDLLPRRMAWAATRREGRTSDGRVTEGAGSGGSVGSRWADLAARRTGGASGDRGWATAQ